MEKITIWISAVGAIQIIIFFLFWRLWRYSVAAKISVSDPVMWDAEILRQKPYRFPVGKKAIFIQPMAAGYYRKFINDFFNFLLLWNQNLKKIQYLDNKEVKETGILKDTARELIKVFQNVKLDKGFRQIIKMTALKCPLNNPQKISFRYFNKWINIEAICELFLLSKAINIDAVESFISCLLDRLQAAGGKYKPGFGLWLNLDGAGKSMKGPRWGFPRYFPPEKRNSSSVNGTMPNTKQMPKPEERSAPGKVNL